jgi:uncharacterized protein YjiS (DUF1127 family)
MIILSTLQQLARGFRNRLAVRSLHDLDDHLLADIGLLQSDVRAALKQSFLSDPSRALKAVCCHWCAYIGAPRPVPGAALCCE